MDILLLVFSVSLFDLSFLGYSLNEDVVLWMKNFNTARMVGENEAILGAGLRFQQVYNMLHPNYPIGGLCGGVGTMGFSLGGGISVFSRQYGLAIDNILEVTMVDACGRLRIINNHTDPELFWAVRGGGGGNFGVVTEIKVRTRKLNSEKHIIGDLCWLRDDAAEVIEYYNNVWTYNIPREMTAYGLWVGSIFCLTIVHNGDPVEVRKIISNNLTLLLGISTSCTTLSNEPNR